MDTRLFYLINKAQHGAFQFAERVHEEHIGVSVAQTAALFSLQKNQGCLQRELGKLMGLNKSGLSGLVDRMVANDLIRKQSDEEDGRAYRLYMTEAGTAAIASAKPLLAKQNKMMTEGFSKAEIDVVARFLNHVIDITKPEKL